MYYLAGGRAVSEYQRIKTKIALDTLTAYYLYFIDTSRPLSASEAVQVHTLLPQSQAIPVDNVEQLPVSGPDYLLVVPRLGTVSPWSSKATEIAKICGFSMIKRLERGVLWCLASLTPPEQVEQLKALIHDRMTEVVLTQIEEAQGLFATTPARPLGMIPLLSQGRAALVTANQAQGLALSASEIDYLLAHFTQIQRDPTDVELMMFAQANSEHCRHKIFKAQWIINEQLQPYSLWQRIRQTYERHPGAILSAYHDNAAVIEGFSVPRFMADPQSHHYGYQTETTAILMKVETHNHPTAISPFPGAATGSGGEIRDEGATGQGAKPKAGLTGFSVSHLRLPEAPQPWESAYETPKRLATALEIMLAGPIGASRFNNEFGRPNICGYFRSFEYTLNAHHRGYHKPIMLAGGLGNIRPNHIQKQKIKPNTALVVLGGPALLIGLGGGAASSIAAGLSDAELDFASVQRENPEMQRRCQEVIDACWQLGADNPILSIHDVGAGGLSNALPELVHDSGCGGRFDLAAIPTADPSLSPLELWCNEAQERYVLAIAQEHLEVFKTLCQRERCPYALVGEATAAPQLQLYQDDRALIDIPLAVLFGHPPQMQRHIKR
ncbi:MAG: phosphoribosylformylglycinamidine synthase, partial [Pseudomonadota bacterium]|nr:phosphoribosylformylglycinamidine synthase [Pseudomonadota bacterium]